MDCKATLKAEELIVDLLSSLDVDVYQQQLASNKWFQAAVRVLAAEAHRDPRASGHFILPRKTKSLERTSDSHQVGVKARRQQQKTRLLNHLKKLTPKVTMQHTIQLIQTARPQPLPKVPPMLARALQKSATESAPVKLSRAHKRAMNVSEFGPAPMDEDEELKMKCMSRSQLTVVMPTGVVRVVDL